MTTTVTAKIQVRKGTAAQWTNANPTLLAGEFGYETDTGKLKIGDGTTAWATLGYSIDLTGGAGVSDHGALTGLADDDHTQYHTDARGDARYALTGHNHSGTYATAEHNHSGTYEPADATILKQADVDDTPVNGVTTAPVSSNWAFDHAALATAHGISTFGASLVDDANAATARTTLGLGTAATAATGDFATAAQGTLAASALQPGGALGTPASGILTNCTGYPIPAVKLDDAAAPDDNTDLNASASAHGLLPKLANTGTKFLRDDGTWQTVSGGSGDVVGPASSTDNTIPRFDSTTGKLIQGSVAILGDDGTFYLEGIAGQTTGNARGAGSVDLQTGRSAATQVASGTNAAAVGARNTVSSNCGFSAGYLNTVSGIYGFAVGTSNTASGTNGSAAIGNSCTASGESSFAQGAQSQATGSWTCAIGIGVSAINRGQFSCGYGPGFGQAQASIQNFYTTTTDATATILNIGNSSSNRLVVPAKRLIAFYGLVSAYSDSTDGYKAKSWEIKGVIERNASNATRIVGTPTIAVLAADTDASGWAITSISADDTNESLSINVTGEAATNIRWGASLFYNQLGYA